MDFLKYYEIIPDITYHDTSYQMTMTRGFKKKCAQKKLLENTQLSDYLRRAEDTKNSWIISKDELFFPLDRNRVIYIPLITFFL